MEIVSYDLCMSEVGFDEVSFDAEALAAFEAEPLAAGTKGWPLAAGSIVPASVREHGWTTWGAQPLPTPLLLIRDRIARRNVETMATFAAEQRVLLAPHAKTTMAPRLIAEQIKAGCWAMTAATPAHARVYRRFGVSRILLANEVVDPAAIAWLAHELTNDPSFEALCLVDSIAGVRLLDAELARAGATRPLPVMLEVGQLGGRGGVRSAEEAVAVARTAAAAPSIELVGVECFEGLAMNEARLARTLADVDDALRAFRVISERLATESLLGTDPILSAGGSAYFDRVVEQLRDGPWRLALRSGCYVTQDGGFYDRVSPLAGRAEGAPLLADALELWATVLSRPEAGLIVVDAGKRDAPYDITPPVPVVWHARGAAPQPMTGASVSRLSDQHMTVAIPPTCPVAIGDRIRFALSHPCGAFDRWALIPLVDDHDVVVGAARTCF